MKATIIGIALVLSPTGAQDARIRDKMSKHRKFTPRTRNRFRERELARARCAQRRAQAESAWRSRSAQRQDFRDPAVPQRVLKLRLAHQALAVVSKRDGFDPMRNWIVAVREQRARVSKNSDTGKAIDYSLKRWPAFTRFLDDGRMCMSNNAAERELRAVAMTDSFCTSSSSAWKH
jgi:Transposase IS66 family